MIDGLGFPEGPRWHDAKWWFSDFFLHQVLTVDVAGNASVWVEIEGQPSGLGWLPDGRLLVVSMLDQRIVAVDANGHQETYADLSSVTTGNANDMVVDDVGRAYVGCYGDPDGAGGRLPATLALVDTDRRVRIAAVDLAFPNGAAITPDGGTLILAELMAHRILAWDRLADGSLENKRVWAELPGIAPDGICLDAEGAVWVPGYKDGVPLLRVAEGGAILERIEMGDRGAYACALGGKNGCSLLICTNRLGPSDRTDRRDGRLETIEVSVPGAAWS